MRYSVTDFPGSHTGLCGHGSDATQEVQRGLRASPTLPKHNLGTRDNLTKPKVKSNFLPRRVLLKYQGAHSVYLRDPWGFPGWWRDTSIFTALKKCHIWGYCSFCLFVLLTIYPQSSSHGRQKTSRGPKKVDHGPAINLSSMCSSHFPCKCYLILRVCTTSVHTVVNFAIFFHILLCDFCHLFCLNLAS